MSEVVNLATYYRPKTFGEVVGQDVAVAALKRIAAADGIACRSIFLKGSYGSGKTSLCKILGKAMNCSKFKELGDVCNECDKCKEASSKNSQLYMEFDSSVVGNVDGIKRIVELLSVIPNGRRVVVFDEVHSCSRQALNALLKVIEEGVKDTIFVFASTEDILETIKSRSVCIDIELIPLSLIKKRVGEIAALRNISISEDDLELLAVKSRGHMRDALSILQFYELVGKEALNTSITAFRKFIFSVLSKSHKDEAPACIDSIMSYNITDIKNSIYSFIRSLYVSKQGSNEYILLRNGAANMLFNYFFSPVASQAMKNEVGMEILLRGLYEKICNR